MRRAEDRVEDHKLIGDLAGFRKKHRAFRWLEMSVEVAREDRRWTRIRTERKGSRVRSYHRRIANRDAQPMERLLALIDGEPAAGKLGRNTPGPEPTSTKTHGGSRASSRVTARRSARIASRSTSRPRLRKYRYAQSMPPSYSGARRL